MPDKPIPLFVVSGTPRFEERRVKMRGMVHHEIHDDAYPGLCASAIKAIEIFDGAENGVDATVVAHVIPEIVHGRGIDRREPDPFNAKGLEIVKFPDGSRYVAYSVPVRIRKASG
jgi:hypothetical protein